MPDASLVTDSSTTGAAGSTVSCDHAVVVAKADSSKAGNNEKEIGAMDEARCMVGSTGERSRLWYKIGGRFGIWGDITIYEEISRKVIRSNRWGVTGRL
ncbi:hypothetical protein GCM10023155_03330 [Bremerella cremea]